MGLVFGSLPGLTATMGVAFLIPLTYTMDPVTSHWHDARLLCRWYCRRGHSRPYYSISLVRQMLVCTVPWTAIPWLKARPRRLKALGWAAFASGIGTFFSWIVLIFCAPLLASMCIEFGSPEYCALAFFGLSIIIAVSGKSLLKGILAGLLGIGISFIGIDPVWGNLRFTFR
jgi:putative tricarboxylic transport membrane protein